jgi:hypothetical protein
MSDVTRMGEEKIKRWLHAVKHLVDLDREKNRASCELANAEQDLGKWLVPEDAKPGEVFCVWFGDSLIQATVGSQGLSNIKAAVRKRGKSLETL